MEIIESDLKQLFQWIENHDRDFKTVDAAIVQLQEETSRLFAVPPPHQDAIESLEKRIINIEKALFELSFVVKNRKN